VTGRQQHARRLGQRVDRATQRPGNDNGADTVEQSRELVADEQ
jgi:hypothetical protein